MHDDDPFADEDEGDYNFSPDAIREDIARHGMSWIDPGASESERAPSPDLDESVSTLDMNGTGPHSPASSPPLDAALDEDEMDGHFSQISLSEFGPSDDMNGTGSPSSSSPRPPPIQIVTDQDEIDDDSPISNGTDHPYPNVVIDFSKSPTHRVTVSLTSEPGGRSSWTSEENSLPRSTSVQSSHSESVADARGSPSPPNAASSSQSIQPSSPPPIPVPLNPQKPTHRPVRSSGPSALEKVRSRTRPSFLPPKNRDEDDKHLSEWESMMKSSRATADKKRRALQDRRIAREKKIEDSLQLWEKEIVPDWKVVHKNPALRKLWWQGIPTKLRASMWANAVGNALALSKDNYRTCTTRAKRALASGSFPSATLSLIEQDITTTLPSLHIFHHENGPLYSDLKDMMCAWVVSRSDEGLGYTLGAAKIAAMLLISMPAQQAFVVMRNVMERHCMRSFFGGDGAKDEVDAYYRIFDTLLADGMPKIYFNFKQHQISPAAYLPDWILPLFLDHLPFEACARIWDVLLLEGDSFLYRASLGILAVLEPRLFFPDRTELLELLSGENKAALDVAAREGRPLDGGRYEIYGVDEETLWERIDSMQDWWKDSTWTRLIQRELPDL
ncbi:rab-GTPase-TBC domain-containing protein [Mycena maculata]|uniref:Rab-GTPase-TBC domain-containing protein n=1 Tax=Mycena maculata TaxID=230809 RepID=A0AAD7HTH1_9AGAR|nr:rab-GTPase-TBC domain-containing protein [Mycena maculata]